jgi:uncharacterized protein (DUF1778 family)
MKVKKAKSQRESFRLSEEDKKTLDSTAEVSGIDKSDIIRLGMLKECKKILRDIEKMDKEL